MDLKEMTINPNRHPWELARAKALRRVVQSYCRWGGRIKRVLDVGCGDGFLLNELCRGHDFEAAHGVDVHLSEQDIARLSRHYPRLKLFPSLTHLSAQRYDAIFLFDVIEHVPDDKIFCEGLIRDHLAPGGTVIITAPAFNSLWSFHDEFLRHYRRYNLEQLRRLTSRLGLCEKASGFFFGSLLGLRVFACAWERLRGVDRDYSGVGRWGGERC